ncbi:hypothetical protein [Jiella marina]|uniref:hypothetical protein n=1 Tax=Jiella sp. LLJ827 TaxID=2917712 RepID=UPI002100EEF3|nr:hypothetical protein [Jiella sp. LLJ827]MCQ0988217.1 hypothetical protein [Jiella sp. LLJ827]
MSPVLTVERCDEPPSVRLVRSGDVDVARLFVGKTPEQVISLVPLIFNLCSAAHRIAAAAALGLPAPADAPIMLAREMLREHALMLLRDWPTACGEDWDIATLSGLARFDRDRLERLDTDLFGVSADVFLRDPATVIARAAIHPTRILKEERGRGTGLCAMPLAGDPTAMARMADDPLLASPDPGQGIDLPTRMLGVLVEAARLSEWLKQRADAPTRLVEAGATEAGVGRAEAARGTLVHRVVVESGRIVSYRVETPTDDMTRKDGFLTKLLSAAQRTPSDIRDRIFKLALCCANPCVAVRVVERAPVHA